MLHSFTTTGFCVYCGCTRQQAAAQKLPQYIVADRHLDPDAADFYEQIAGPLAAESRELIRRAFAEI